MFLPKLKKLWKFCHRHRVRVVYTLGLIPSKTKVYRIGNKNIIGCEGYSLITDEYITYKVDRHKRIQIFVPMLLSDVPFFLFSHGRLAPAYPCKGYNTPVDYIYWIPENYKDKFNENS